MRSSALPCRLFRRHDHFFATFAKVRRRLTGRGTPEMTVD